MGFPASFGTKPQPPSAPGRTGGTGAPRPLPTALQPRPESGGAERNEGVSFSDRSLQTGFPFSNPHVPTKISWCADQNEGWRKIGEKADRSSGEAPALGSGRGLPISGPAPPHSPAPEPRARLLRQCSGNPAFAASLRSSRASFSPPSFPFCLLHAHSPPPITATSSTAFTTTITPKICKLCPCRVDSSEGSPRKTGRTQSRDEDTRLSIPAPSLQAAPASPVGKGRRKPEYGEGRGRSLGEERRSERGDTGDGDGAEPTPPCDPERYPSIRPSVFWDLGIVYQGQDFRVERSLRIPQYPQKFVLQEYPGVRERTNSSNT